MRLPNQGGNPLEYERDGKPLALCYADCAEAQEALAQNRKAYPGLGLRLVAIGLGDAYERKAAGGAVVVPGSAALDAARNPSGEAWDDGTIPLFGCLQMTMPNAYGETVCPLFMCPDDAERAVGNAKPPTQQPGDDPAGFDLTIVCISLDRALDLVTRRSAGAVGFQFVPPAASVAWLQNGRPGGEARAAATAAPRAPRRSSAMSSGERLTPFMLFFCEHRDVVQAAHPTLAPHELSALIADKWKALPADRARAYGVLSATYAEQKKPGVTAQPRKRKERREKDPKAPKSATSAYMRVRPRAPAAAGLRKPPNPRRYFSKHHRLLLKRENSDLTFGDLGKTVGAMWKAATPQEKKPFEDLAAADRTRYNSEPPSTGSGALKSCVESASRKLSQTPASAFSNNFSALSRSKSKGFDGPPSGSGPTTVRVGARAMVFAASTADSASRRALAAAEAFFAASQAGAIASSSLSTMSMSNFE
ncbi:hypothetical protein JL721_6435 [Aureococcus anophagefferens]|nr:hypothetical protein JL721_6435 [Aureococcus anophagefferens]